MKFVYVLVSDLNDYFYEQFLVSIYSLKQTNKDAYISLLMDRCTKKNLIGKRMKYLEFVDEEIVLDFPSEFSKKKVSRDIKTNMRNLVDGDFWYLDCDTIITGALPELSCNLGMVLNRHANISQWPSESVVKESKKYHFSPGYEDKHFNSGVIWAKDTVDNRDFFNQWHEKYFELYNRGVSYDQASLNDLNSMKAGYIQEIDGIYNCQVTCGVKYISNAKVIHYLGFMPYLSNYSENILPHKIADEKHFLFIKQNGEISNETKEIVNNAENEFVVSQLLPYDNIETKILFSKHFKLMKFIYTKINLLWNFNESLLENMYFFLNKKN